MNKTALILFTFLLFGCEKDQSEYEYRILGLAGTYDIEYNDHRGNLVKEKVSTPWIYSGRIYQTAHLYLKVPSYEPIVELVIGDLTIQSMIVLDSIQMINIVVTIQEDW